jgi:DUF4097 and DUF4098 domain-containing protein YvlB
MASVRLWRLSHRLVPRVHGPYGRHVADDSPIPVRISGSSGRVTVTAVAGEALRVVGDARVTESPDQITIDHAHGRVSITVPAGTDIVIGTTSGRVTVGGPVGHVALVSASGRVDIEQAASVDVRTESSSVEVGEVTGTCRVRAQSGRVEIGRCGAADIASKSGRVVLDHVDGAVDVHSVSGRIEVSLATAHDVHAETVTGRIEISLPSGTVAFELDGPTDDRLRPPGTDCTVFARSLTGRVVVASR